MLIRDPSKAVLCFPSDILRDTLPGKIVKEIYDHPLSVAHVDELAYLLAAHRDTVASIVSQCDVCDIIAEHKPQSQFFSIPVDTFQNTPRNKRILHDQLGFPMEYLECIYQLVTTQRAFVMEQLHSDFERRKHIYQRESLLSQRARGQK